MKAFVSLFLGFCSMNLVVASNSPHAAYTDSYPKNPNVDVINYRFNLELSDQTDIIEASATIDFVFKVADMDKLRLDLIAGNPQSGIKGMEVMAITQGDYALGFTHQNDELLIFLKAPPAADQVQSVTIRYRGIPAAGLYIGNNKYGDRTFFSDNWPNKARNWLPTVDHPYDKATCEFIVTAPHHYQVISNGLKKEETNLDDGLKRTHWKQAVPIASWLYVLGVAEFAVQYVDEFDGKSIQTWVYKQDRDAGFYDFAEPTKQVLEYYSTQIGPYSYEKLANVQSNSVSGGMEAASAILYDDDAVTGDRSERWRNVVIHEIAHQWFGNAVTEYDWDDVWLSEGFATYFTLLFIEHAYGREAFLEGLQSSKTRVDAYQAEHPEYTIIHNNLADMSRVTSSQTYQKGSWFLHMLRGVMGTDLFWEGIRAYYAEFKDRNATTQDFKRIMESVSGLDLEQFFRQWLYEPGTLKVTGSWRYDFSSQSVILELKQIQTDGSLFQMPVEVEIHHTSGTKTLHRVQLREQTNRYEIKADAEPANLVLDPYHWVLLEGELKRL
ncbi:MAG: hypothetical protein RLZZ241_2294 [Bacteroidota bacterium]|jgi:aminopeptidase N